MVEVQILITIVSVIIALGSLVTAIIVMARNKTKDTKTETKEYIETRAGLQSQINVINETFSLKLESIDSGVRDLRADNRGFRGELQKLRDDLRDEMREIHDEAKHGVELAEAAHRRLDRIGAEKDSLLKEAK